MSKEAPERIWIDEHDIADVSASSQIDPDYVQYIRFDKAEEARTELWDTAITIASGKSASGALMPSEIVEALEAAKADEQNQEGEIR